MALSRRGRRLSEPVPGWAGGLGLVLLACYALAFTAGAGSRAEPVYVAYMINGAGLADVELSLPGDGERVRLSREAVPLRRNFSFRRGEQAVVSASGVGGGLVSCSLQVGNRVVAERTGQSVVCGGTIGDPATYQPAPDGAPSDSPALLGQVMEPSRYSGRSSPVEGRLVDRAAGLSYADLGGGWGPPPSEQESSTAQSMLTLRKESRPERGWFSRYGSGVLDPPLLYRYEGDRGLFQVALSQQDALTGLPVDSSYKDLASAPLTVDGRRAWVIVRQITFGPGAQTPIRTQLQVMVMVDTGRERPGYLFVDMSDPAHDYLPDVDRLISSLRVL